MNTKHLKIQQRVDTIRNWSDNNPILLNKEIGFEKETGRFKIGDGATSWNKLPYQNNTTYATSTGGINQLFDSGDTFDFTDKNPNATELDSTLTGNITKGATGNYASSFGGKSAAIGKRSHAEGTTTIAKGNYSHVEGDNSVALGDDSHAEGYATVTLGNASHSEGTKTIAKGNYSHAEGSSAIALGLNSHAEGNETKAIGDISHAEGGYTEASGKQSHAEGAATIASGDYSHSEGKDSKASNVSSHAEGAATIASGLYSHAEGSLNQAKEESSHAEGNQTIASGKFSHSEGDSTIAAANTSHAEGYNTKILRNLDTSSGSDSSEEETPGKNTGTSTEDWKLEEHYGECAHVEGVNSIALGYGSHAENNSSALGTFSHSEGYKTTAGSKYNLTAESAAHSEGMYAMATGKASHAEGYGVIASGESSHAEGKNTTASYMAAHAEGIKTYALYRASHAEGESTRADGRWSHSEGYITQAFNDTAHAEGYNTKAQFSYSHAEGQNTIASNNAAHAEGSGTKASGLQSHAEGAKSESSGNQSHAEGYYTTASGVGSHAEGAYTGAVGNFQHVQGKYNKRNTEYAHIIGNGTSDSLSNAHTVDWKGNAWYQGKIKIGGTSYNDTKAKEIATKDYIEINTVDDLLKQSIYENKYIKFNCDYLQPENEINITFNKCILVGWLQDFSITLNNNQNSQLVFNYCDLQNIAIDCVATEGITLNYCTIEKCAFHLNPASEFSNCSIVSTNLVSGQPKYSGNNNIDNCYINSRLTLIDNSNLNITNTNLDWNFEDEGFLTAQSDNYTSANITLINSGVSSINFPTYGANFKIIDGSSQITTVYFKPINLINAGYTNEYCYYNIGTLKNFNANIKGIIMYSPSFIADGSGSYATTGHFIGFNEWTSYNYFDINAAGYFKITSKGEILIYRDIQSISQASNDNSYSYFTFIPVEKGDLTISDEIEKVDYTKYTITAPDTLSKNTCLFYAQTQHSNKIKPYFYINRLIKGSVRVIVIDENNNVIFNEVLADGTNTISSTNYVGATTKMNIFIFGEVSKDNSSIRDLNFGELFYATAQSSTYYNYIRSSNSITLPKSDSYGRIENQLLEDKSNLPTEQWQYVKA